MAMCAIILNGTILADIDTGAAAAAVGDSTGFGFIRSRNSCFSYISVKGMVCMLRFHAIDHAFRACHDIHGSRFVAVQLKCRADTFKTTANSITIHEHHLITVPIACRRRLSFFSA